MSGYEQYCRCQNIRSRNAWKSEWRVNFTLNMLTCSRWIYICAPSLSVAELNCHSSHSSGSEASLYHKSLWPVRAMHHCVYTALCVRISRWRTLALGGTNYLQKEKCYNWYGVYVSYRTEDNRDVYKNVQKQHSKRSPVRIITVVLNRSVCLTSSSPPIHSMSFLSFTKISTLTKTLEKVWENLPLMWDNSTYFHWKIILSIVK